MSHLKHRILPLVQILSWDLHLPVTGRGRSNLRFDPGDPMHSLSQPWSDTSPGGWGAKSETFTAPV